MPAAGVSARLTPRTPGRHRSRVRMDDRTHDFLRQLLETPSPSGFEQPVQALVRRATRAPEPTTLSVDDIALDLLSRRVTRGGAPIDLRPREFALLEYLMRNAGKVVSKTMILSHVWEYNFDPQTNIVDVLVSRLREKIDRPFEKKLLHTVRGVGYVLRA